MSVLHRMMRYMDMPGEEPSGYHEKVIGLLGDIMSHQYPAVEVPWQAFHLVQTPVRVPTVAAMNALLPAWEAPSTPLGPFTEEAGETEVVRPRNVQLVPGCYASLFIHRRGLTVKTVFEEIYGLMQARDEVAACADILAWVRAACTARGGGGAQNGIPIVFAPLYPVHLPPAAYRYMIGELRGDLPALADPDPATAEVTGTLAGALRALSRGRGGETDKGDRTTREPKGVQDVYKETYRTLLRFCNVARVEDVAPLWGRLANCSKSEQHTILTQEFQRVCMARGLATELYTPIITATLKQMIVGFLFVRHGADDLSTGCQPFQVTYSGSANHLEALATSSIGNQLAQGEQSASLEDYRTIREKEKVRFPRDIMEVGITLSRFAVLCQALFQGTEPRNPLVESLWHLTAAMHNAVPFISERFQQVARNPAVANVYFACVIRAVQVNVFEYLHGVGTNVVEGHTGVDLPDFRSLVTDLKHGTFHVSQNWIPLPEAYIETRGGTGAASRTPSTVTTAASSVLTVRTGVSTLTADTTRAPVARIENPTPDTDFFSSIIVRPGGTRPGLRERRPPSNDAGHEFCVAWWLRSACFPNCGRQQTHVPFASSSERTRLLAYCREHLAAPASAAAAT